MGDLAVALSLKLADTCPGFGRFCEMRYGEGWTSFGRRHTYSRGSKANILHRICTRLTDGSSTQPGLYSHAPGHQIVSRGVHTLEKLGWFVLCDTIAHHSSKKNVNVTGPPLCCTGGTRGRTRASIHVHPPHPPPDIFDLVSVWNGRNISLQVGRCWIKQRSSRHEKPLVWVRVPGHDCRNTLEYTPVRTARPWPASQRQA